MIEMFKKNSNLTLSISLNPIPGPEADPHEVESGEIPSPKKC